MPLTNVAPRFGLAYSADDKTVVRSGFGITYTQFNREGGENLLAYNGPYIVNASIDQNPAQPLCTSDTQNQTAFDLQARSRPHAADQRRSAVWSCLQRR